jgi:hypothetical protein
MSKRRLRLISNKRGLGNYLPHSATGTAPIVMTACGQAAEPRRKDYISGHGK